MSSPASNVFLGATKKLSLERRVSDEPAGKSHPPSSGSSTLGRRKRSGSKYANKLSGGSFKGKFGTFEARDRGPSKSEASATGASVGSSSTSSLSSSASTASRSSLNRIANSASNFQNYASRYIESIRPKSWGKPPVTPGLLGPPVHPVGTKSAGSSRAESPLGGIPHLLIFRSPSGRASAAAGDPGPKLSAVPRQSRDVGSDPRQDPRWFKHITEATNLHRFPDASKKTHDRGSDVSSQNGLSLDGSGQAGSSHDLLGASGYDSGKAASRSESFNDSSSFKRDQGGLEVDESLQKKTGDGSTTHGANEPSSTSSSGQRKRLQRVEILKIAEPCPLIDPSQVVVTQGAIFLAEAVLTPIEKLRRKDIEVARALEEKQRLIAEILNVPSEDFDHIADLASQPSSDKGAREVLLAALAQAKSLSDLVNQSLNLSDEDRIAAGSEVSANLSSTRDNTPTSPMATGEPHLHTSSGGRDGTAGSDSLLSQKFHGHFPGAMSKPTEKLVSISVHLNSHLTTLLGIIQERDEERERMKRELQRSQEQVHAYLSQSTSVRTSSMSALSPGSRPASFISVEESSGTGDLSEKGAQESGEDDGARPYANLFDPSEENHPPEPVTPTNPTPTAYEVDLEGSRTPDPLSSADATDFGQSSETSPSDSDKTVTELTPTESSVVSAPDNPESGPESAPVSMEPVGETDA